MSALTAARVSIILQGTIKKTAFPLKNGSKAYSGGIACIDTANIGYIYPATVSTTLKAVGLFLDSVDNTAGAAAVPIGVELRREREVLWLDSVTGAGAISIANLFQTVYLASDHELTTVSSGASIAGIVWGIGAQGYPNSVAIEPLF